MTGESWSQCHPATHCLTLSRLGRPAAQLGVRPQMERGVTFYLGSQPVGQFLNSPPPQQEGDFAYDPLRGPGHLNLTSQLNASHRPRCHYFLHGMRVDFSVTGHPKYAVLTLTGFVRDSGIERPQ
jgi:hypothetical protein